MKINQLSKIPLKLILLIIISQMVLMNIGFQQFRSVHTNTTVNIVTPCSKTASHAATKICENVANAFLAAEQLFVLIFSNQSKMFFPQSEVLSFGAPVYAIYKPPKK